jgi:hypothetical protein
MISPSRRSKGSMDITAIGTMYCSTWGSLSANRVAGSTGSNTDFSCTVNSNNKVTSINMHPHCKMLQAHIYDRQKGERQHPVSPWLQLRVSWLYNLTDIALQEFCSLPPTLPHIYNWKKKKKKSVTEWLAPSDLCLVGLTSMVKCSIHPTKLQLTT